MKNPLTLKGMKVFLPRAHLEASQGTAEQNRAYATKEGGKTVEFGVMPQQGKRNDIHEMVETIASKHMTVQEAILEYPAMAVRYSKGIEKLCNALQTHRDKEEPPKVYWLHGETGTGKTRWAIDEFGVANCYIKDATRWWDGYEQQKCIIIDDFDGQWPERDLLRLLDRFPYQGQVKGGYVKINSPYIVITCEFPPERFYTSTMLSQIKRRLTEVRRTTVAAEN